MNIIVTGGAGFIGSNFVFHMLKKYPDYRIICLDKLTYAGNLSTLAPVMDNPNFRFVKADICDREAVDKRFTVICRWIVLTCSLLRRLLFTPALRTAAPRLQLICWFWLITVPTACL